MKNCGWSPRNLSGPLTSMLDPIRNQEAKTIVGVEEIEVDEDGNKLQIIFAESTPVNDRHLQTIRDLVEKESLQKNGVVFKAIKEISLNPEANSVVIEMIQSDTPHLREVRKGHFVSCLLYDYNYYDQETSREEPNAPELYSNNQ